MSDNMLNIWKAFEANVTAHIKDTLHGHYAYGTTMMQPLHALEQTFGLAYLCGQVCKYMFRYPQTHNERDLYKAAHYLSRLWALKHFQKGKKNA